MSILRQTSETWVYKKNLKILKFHSQATILYCDIPSIPEVQIFTYPYEAFSSLLKWLKLVLEIK